MREYDYKCDHKCDRKTGNVDCREHIGESSPLGAINNTVLQLKTLINTGLSLF